MLAFYINERFSAYTTLAVAGLLVVALSYPLARRRDAAAPGHTLTLCTLMRTSRPSTWNSVTTMGTVTLTVRATITAMTTD
ncbi:MAG: hypothetical protein R3A10_21730 [Caldilineaceae bacterium]